MTTMPLPARPVTGRHVLIGMIAAFGVISAVNLALVVFALRTYTGEIEPKSYAVGLDFNNKLADVAAQRERGWVVDATFAAIAGSEMTVESHYADRDGSALRGLDVVAEFVRPTTEGYDFSLPLREQGDGRYGATATLPLPGQWKIRLVARDSGNKPYILDYTTVAK